MDLNYLFLRQQVERSKAETAVNEAARDAHRQMARAYELEIERKSEGRIIFSWGREARAIDALGDQLISERPNPSPP